MDRRAFLKSIAGVVVTGGTGCFSTKRPDTPLITRIYYEYPIPSNSIFDCQDLPFRTSTITFETRINSIRHSAYILTETTPYQKIQYIDKGKERGERPSLVDEIYIRNHGTKQPDHYNWNENPKEMLMAQDLFLNYLINICLRKMDRKLLNLTSA